MKNIFQDDTLPSGTDLPPVPKNGGKPMPSRPKRDVTPPPMKQAMQPQPVYVPVQSAPAQQTAPEQGDMPAYQYIPVNPQYPPQGVAYYPVYGNGQGVPYAPYPQQYAPAPQAPAEQEAPKNEFDPGTRVLFQSPDFENKDGSGYSDNVGANFADIMKKNAKALQDTEDKKDDFMDDNVEYEEVSISAPVAPGISKRPQIVRKAPVITTQDLTDEDIYTDSETGDISFAAYNAVNPSLEVEDFKQELPLYDENEGEEVYLDETEGTKKPLPKSELIRRIVLGVSVVAIIISAGMLLNEWRLSKENDDVMEEANDLIITQANKENNKDEGDEDDDKNLTPEEQWAKIKEEYPNVLFPATIQLKYAKLYGENQDFVGYLSAEGIGLNLPVVQTTNDETYLNKNFYGSTTKYGCPFVTHLNNIS